MKYLVCYDITETKRLYRISKAMESLGYRVQKSFFTCDLSKTEYEMLCDVINNTIEPNDDKVAIYEICEKCVSNGVYIGCSVNSFFKDDYLIL